MSTRALPPPEPVRSRLPLVVVGIVIFIGSELMFFASLFGTYFTLRARSTEWAPSDIRVNFYRAFFTAVLVASSFTMQHAVGLVKRGKVGAMKRWVWLTWLMGATFLGAQAHEWATTNFQISTNAYGSTFFTLTGFHGLHVFAGLMIMLVILGRAAAGAYSADEHAGIEVAAYYWHFVDVVWIALFSTIFIVR